MNVLDLPAIGDILVHWGEMRPEAAVLHDALGVMTHAALRQSLRDAARALAVLPVGRGRPLAICLEEAPQVARHVLACCPFVPCLVLDPKMPLAELASALRLARAGAMVATPGSPAAQGAAAAGVPTLEPGFHGHLPRAPAGSVLSFAGAGDIALILATSGTTGQPRLVPRSHANYIANARITVPELGLLPGETCLLPMPLHHTLGMNNLVSNAVMSGGCAVPLGGFEPQAFAAWARLTNAQWAAMSPTVAEHLLRAMEQDPFAFAGWRPRVVRVGAAAVTPDLAARLMRMLGCPVAPSYGSSEGGTIACAMHPMPDGKGSSAGKVVIPGFRIVGPDGRAAAAGADGVIEVRGPTVFSGYPGPERGISEDGWFTTGDIGRLDQDGFLFIVGRESAVIKRGGVKVSPEEAESWLRSQPGIAEAVCFGIPHASLAEDLVGFVVPLPGMELDAAGLRRSLLRALPGHKVPSQLLCREALPMGPAGKVRRAELPALFAAALPAVTEQPRTAAEVMVAGAFQRTLGRDAVGRLDNFFLLGGDSLAAVSLLLEIEAASGRPVTVAELLEDPTPAGLAAALDGKATTGIGGLVVEHYRTGTGAEHLFVMPGADGLPHAILPLLPHLPPSLGVIGLRAPSGLQVQEAAVDAVAEDVAAAVNALRRGGVCHLLGYSLGGRVAHAAARSLEAQGRPPASLILIDPSTTLADVKGCDALATSGVPAFLLRSWEQPLRRLQMPGLGWEHLCRGGLQVVDIATTHFGMMAAPHAETAARRVGEALRRDTSTWFVLPHESLPVAFQAIRKALAATDNSALAPLLAELPSGSLPGWAAATIERAAQLARRGGSTAGDGAPHAAVRACPEPWSLSPGAAPRAIGQEAWLLARAIGLHRRGLRHEALEGARELHRILDPTPDLFTPAFFECANAGWPDAAWAFHAVAVQAAAPPARAMAHDIAAQLHAMSGQVGAAVEEGRRAVAANPQVIEYRMRLVASLLAAGLRPAAQDEAAIARRIAAGRAWVSDWLDARLAA